MRDRMESDVPTRMNPDHPDRLRTRGPRPAVGFTLIELLVDMAIIGIVRRNLWAVIEEYRVAPAPPQNLP